jgi:hypothetical protein
VMFSVKLGGFGDSLGDQEDPESLKSGGWGAVWCREVIANKSGSVTVSREGILRRLLSLLSRTPSATVYLDDQDLVRELSAVYSDSIQLAAAAGVAVVQAEWFPSRRGRSSRTSLR